MIAPSAPPHARIFTMWGTVLYVDEASGELRHGPIDGSPANAVFRVDPEAPPECRRGWLLHTREEASVAIRCTGERSLAVDRPQEGDADAAGTLLELIPLERGLLGFTADGRFLCAEPDGRVTLERPWCSTWEWFLASEDWCGAPLPGSSRAADLQKLAINWKGVAKCIIDARLRVKANPVSKATKVLIYGYPAWSHGRVYYDLCKHLYNRGYIVDIINWQENHAHEIDELLSYYDLFVSALDGVRALTEVYGVPCDRVIGLSHHEMDIRMLLDQMGKEVFEKFAAYGVVGYQLYDASTLLGVTREPLVVPLGVDVDVFRADPPERLAIVGYAGSYTHKTLDGLEWKRGEIAEASAREAGLEFKIAGWTGNQISFHDMPEFYKSVDAVLVSSVTEGAGLPAKEAAAAGRLVISTPVGDFPLRAAHGIGIVAPMESHKYVKFVADTLRHYKDNPAAFAEICRKTQEAARQLDWQYIIDDWVELIETAKAKPRPGEERFDSTGVRPQPSPLAALNLSDEFHRIGKAGFNSKTDLCEKMTSYGSDKGGPLLVESSARNEPVPTGGSGQTFWDFFEREAAPRLGIRAGAYRKIFEYLDALHRPVTIVETGCVRTNSWDEGKSTVLFGEYARSHVGSCVWSVDSSEQAVALARSLTEHLPVNICQLDSVQFLNKLTGAVDLLYLDSCDVYDLDHPGRSAEHHQREFEAALRLLRPHTLVVVDDSPMRNGRVVGKGMLLAEQMAARNVSVLFSEYQTGWVPSTEPMGSPSSEDKLMISGPVLDIPEQYISRFSMGGRIPIKKLFLDEEAGGHLHWSHYEYEQMLADSREVVDRGIPKRYSSDVHLSRLLQRHSISGKEVLIIGSANPFYEALAHHFGALTTTVDYRKITAEVDSLCTFTVDELAKSGREFDCGISISSIEHSGLGRYGDLIDPNGDLVAMQLYSRHIKKEGHLFLQVPIGLDCVVWNAHRIYGGLRLPELLRGWQIIATEGFDEAMLSGGQPGDYTEPVFVLRNP